MIMLMNVDFFGQNLAAEIGSGGLSIPLKVNLSIGGLIFTIGAYDSLSQEGSMCIEPWLSGNSGFFCFNKKTGYAASALISSTPMFFERKSIMVTDIFSVNIIKVIDFDYAKIRPEKNFENCYFDGIKSFFFYLKI